MVKTEACHASSRRESWDEDRSFDSTGIACLGYCAACDQVHGLGEGAARRHCLTLMRDLERVKRIDLLAADHEADPRCSIAYLLGRARGQMFGVMEYLDQDGNVGTARAFSGQYNGLWHVPGWVPPVVDIQAQKRISVPVEGRIKELGRTIEKLGKGSMQHQVVVRERRDLSRQLMQEIHALYQVRNFRGQSRSLKDIFLGPGGMPAGTGDCCAPKLLHYAICNDFVPLGIAEFFWGRENRSCTRQHGCFYPACREKCQPMLGFMLCGLDEASAKRDT
ncbi:MAG: hypothetical protein WCR47_06010 [Desulfoplanes sp.]